MPSTAGWQRFFVFCGSLILVVGALYLARGVLIPVVLAILLTFVLSPLVNWLQRRKLPRGVAVPIVVVATLLVVGSFGAMVGFQLNALAAELPRHKENILAKIESIREAGKGSVLDELQNTIDEIVQRLKTSKQAEPQPDSEPLPVKVESSGLTALLQTAASPAVELLVDTGLVVVLVIFMLLQRETLRNRILRLWGHGNLTSTTRAVDDAAQRISRFLLMQLVVNTTFGAAFGLGLYFIGVPYSLLWGFLAGTLRYVPYIGPWIAVTFPIALSVAISSGWTQPLLLVGLVLVLELVTNNVMEPLLYGSSIGVSEAALLIAVAFWAWLWGPIGLVVATPLTACLVVLGRYVPQLEFLSILLGGEPVLETDVRYYQRLLARDEYEAADVVETFLEAHTPEETYERVLLPALVLASESRERGELTKADENFFLQVTRNLLDEILPAPPTSNGDDDAPAESEDFIAILGCPARTPADELALQLFWRSCPSRKHRYDQTSPHLVVAEVVARVADESPSVVVIGVLMPGSLAHARYLCKRLRTRFPSLKIVVGCWGPFHHVERTRRKLQEAGADHVGFSLAESRSQLAPLVQFLSHTSADLVGSAKA